MSNPFSSWTHEMVDSFNARTTTKKQMLNHLTKPENIKERFVPPKITVTQVAPKKRALLNKTEQLWKQELERRGHKSILAQAITFNLGDRLNYRPDFTVVCTAESGLVCLICYETKSLHRFARAGINKLKAAARQYPWIKWILVVRDKSKWTEKEIGGE